VLDYTAARVRQGSERGSEGPEEAELELSGMNRRRFLTASAAMLSGWRFAGAPGSYALLNDSDHTRAATIGVNVNHLTEEVLRQLEDLGARHIRVPAILQSWETSDRHRIDLQNIAQWSAAAGIHVLWYLHNIPAGHATPASVRSRAEWMRRMTAFAEWMAALEGTEAIQLWNEADQWVQAPFGAAEGIDAEESGRLYSEQLEMATPRIKAVNAEVLVIAAGTADARGRQRYAGFLRGLIAEAPPLDAVAVHSYGNWERSRSIVLEARRIAGSTPLWVTEFGNDVERPFTESHHLSTWRTPILGNREEQLASRMYGYCLQTDPRHPMHGLLNVDGSPRSAYLWLRDEGILG
jgi:Glycosyl hydrolase catalytic core